MPLYKAIADALQQGADIITLDTLGNIRDRETVLHKIFSTAPFLNYTERLIQLVQMLLRWDSIHLRELNVPDKDGTTPFMLAVQTMPLPIIEAFIKLGAHVDSIDKDNSTPLGFAITDATPDINGRIDPRHEDNVNAVVELLLTKGARVDGGGKDYPKCTNCGTVHIHNPLYEAVEFNFLKVARTLLQAHATIYEYVLPLAADKNNVEMVKLLLSYKPPINGLDDDGHSALTWACIHQNFPIMELLLNARADIDIPDEDGFTPLMILSMKGNLSLVSRLVGRGAQVNKTDPKGRTALMYAAQKGYNGIVGFLLENGADPLAVDKDGYDAYWFAKYKAPSGEGTQRTLKLLQIYKEAVRKNMVEAEVPNPLFQGDFSDIWETIGEYATPSEEEGTEYETKAMLYGEPREE